MTRDNSALPYPIERLWDMEPVDKLASENVDSTDSSVRYLAYGARLRTALRAGQRYIAYVCFSRNALTMTSINYHRAATSAKPFVPLYLLYSLLQHMACPGCTFAGTSKFLLLWNGTW